jgi:multiple sugar transport system ATP-binding protein
MAPVAISEVRKSFGALETIKGVSMQIPSGAFAALVGPSGCGKSTLLRMIAGLEDIDGGTISIGGRIINNVEPKHRNIAMVFQNYALYPHMTVSENMAFSLKLAKRPKYEIEGKVAQAAATLGLADYLDRYPKQLSGGQRQRVAMGRAIVRQPEVYLFDEPLSNLDAKLRVQMRAELKNIHSRLKTTTIYVTHDQVEAMTMADVIVVMRDGKVEQIGTPLDLYDFPLNTFVAGFIGSPSMNILRGRWNSDRRSFMLEGGAAVPHATMPPQASAPALFGIRPEHLSLSNNEDGIEAIVVNVEPTGAETFVQAIVGEQLIGAQLRERVTFQPGEMIRLRVQDGKAHLFDDLGLRLA